MMQLGRLLAGGGQPHEYALQKRRTYEPNQYCRDRRQPTRDSFNAKLARAIAKLAPGDFTFKHSQIGDLPLYN